MNVSSCLQCNPYIFTHAFEVLHRVLFQILINGFGRPDFPQVLEDILWMINSLAPSRFWLNFRGVIFKQILVIDGWVISCEITLRWMSQGRTNDKSTLVQVMAWCPQATSHYLNQCWPRSMSPYGVTRLQWVNSSANHTLTLEYKISRHFIINVVKFMKLQQFLGK